MTNCCPNSTANTAELYLRKISYPIDETPYWGITAEEVNQVIQAGKTPLIKLPMEVNEVGKPKIAIILAQDAHPDRTEKDYTIHPDYIDAIVNFGGVPVLLAYDKIEEQMQLHRFDGVLLIGGFFTSPPEWYIPVADEPTDKRGSTYLKLIKFAEEHKLPTLGICAGHQMLAGTHGAMLKKGINANLPPEKSHKQPGYKIAHNVIIEKDSLLYDIIGETKIATNSSHNEAVRDDITGDCKIVAKAEDGIVEAIELKEPWHPFVLGVQWHPERLVRLNDEASKKIFERFISETKNVRA